MNCPNYLDFLLITKNYKMKFDEGLLVVQNNETTEVKQSETPTMVPLTSIWDSEVKYCL